VLAHRLITGLDAQMGGRSADAVVSALLRALPVRDGSGPTSRVG
jgi:hypothetical protein